MAQAAFSATEFQVAQGPTVDTEVSLNEHVAYVNGQDSAAFTLESMEAMKKTQAPKPSLEHSEH